MSLDISFISLLHSLVEMANLNTRFSPVHPHIHPSPHPSAEQIFEKHLLSARPLPGIFTRPGPYGLPLPEAMLSSCARMDRLMGPCVWLGLASGLRAYADTLVLVCASSSSKRVPSCPSPLQTGPFLPLTTQAKSPRPGTHQNLILQRGNHSNHEKHRERGERVTEAEWETCGWQLTGSLAPMGPFLSGEGALRAWRPSGTLHPSGRGTGAHSPGFLKPSSCSSGCSSAEH